MNFINNYKIDCPTLARCVLSALPSRAGSSVSAHFCPLLSRPQPPAFWEVVSLGQLRKTQVLWEWGGSMHERQFLDTGTMRKGKEWGRAEPAGLPEGGEPEAPLLPSPLLQVLSDGEEGLPGSPLSQLDACLLCLPLLLPALQEPRAHQLPRVSGCVYPVCCWGPLLRDKEAPPVWQALYMHCPMGPS